MIIKARQLADAILFVARIDHYMVGIIEPVLPHEIRTAKQILISQQNALPKQSGMIFQRYELALELLENMEKKLIT